MKKLISLFSALFLLLLCVSCSQNSSGTADFKTQDAMDAMLAQAPIEDSLVLGESDMLDFYGISPEEMEQFSAVMCADGITAKEIVLVKATSDDNAQKVETSLKNRLQNRANEADGYNPEQFAIIQKCEVKRDGRYIRMIISPEATQLTEIYNQYLSGK